MTAWPGADPSRLLGVVRGPLQTFGIHTYLTPAYTPARTAALMAGLHALAEQGYAINLNIDDEVLLQDPNSAYTAPPSTADFVSFVRKIVAEDGSWLKAVEITNEPNLPIPNTSDGANPQIVDDLVKGVVAAKNVARAHRFPVQVGFNYVFSYDVPNDVAFWTRLKAAATPQFLRDVDWMGLHTYPNYVSLDTPVNATTNYEEQQGLATAAAGRRGWASRRGCRSTSPRSATPPTS